LRLSWQTLDDWQSILHTAFLDLSTSGLTKTGGSYDALQLEVYPDAGPDLTGGRPGAQFI